MTDFATTPTSGRPTIHPSWREPANEVIETRLSQLRRTIWKRGNYYQVEDATGLLTYEQALEELTS